MDPDENLFGVPRLRDILDGQHEAALDGLQKTILASVDDFSRGVSQADDITLLLVRYLPTAQSAMSQT
jgi:serine phosphatase RsbU (regulator of sigma subunit)